MEWPFISQIISGLLGGGLVGFIEFLIRRADAKKDKNSEILRAIDTLSEKVDAIETRFDRDNADRSRRRLLVFDDELRRGEGHSQESFNQIMEDADFYKRYCHDHPEYENNKAVSAISNIIAAYQRASNTNGFI